MIDIEKFICSLLADHPVGVTVREDIHKALKDQGLEYKGGKIVPIEDKTALKESEDERVKSVILKALMTDEAIDILVKCGIYYEDVESWLEKQGEQKPADKVEPKFKVGDKIRIKTPSSFDKDMQVARIEKDYYICNHIGKFSSEVIPFSEESSYDLIEQKPTEKPVWYDNMDDLIADEMIDEIKKSDIPEGSKHNRIYWINKHRVYPQSKQEWSKEERQIIKDAACCILDCVNTAETKEEEEKLEELADKLQNLRPRSTWKPSGEQMKYLWKYAEQNNYDGSILASLYQDLKKLKG